MAISRSFPGSSPQVLVDEMLRLRRVVAATVQELVSADRVEESAGRSWATADRNLDGRPAAGRWACRSGCSACCHEAVPVAFPEAVLIARTLERSCSPTDLAELRTAFAAGAAVASSCTSTAEYLLQHRACPLLDPSSRRCAAYRARPLSCRLHHSIALEDCERRATDPRTAVATDLVAAGIGSAVFLGLSDGCTAGHLDGRPLELQAAVLFCLDHPEATSHWLDGDRLPLPSFFPDDPHATPGPA